MLFGTEVEENYNLCAHKLSIIGIISTLERGALVERGNLKSFIDLCSSGEDHLKYQKFYKEISKVLC